MERSFRFDDDDDESGVQGENAEGRGGEADHGPSTPRSKHSAMEQRRRSKINDRFQMLRELVPHSDQKRDKASLLLEVIEHIRLLHEKVQKYEPSDPGWTEENSKSMPWGEVYFRSCWKNAQNNGPGPGDGYVDPSQNIKNSSLFPELVHSRNNNISLTSTIAQNPAQPDSSAGGSFKGTESRGLASEVAAGSFPHPNLYAYVGTIAGDSQSQQLISDADNIASLSHTPWLRSPCLPEDTLKEQGLEIDKGTISVSSAYSEGLLTALSETLQNSGIDFSQASISVDINLGKRASNISPNVQTTMSNAKDADDRSSGQRANQHSRVGSCGEDSEQAPKRHKSDNS